MEPTVVPQENGPARNYRKIRPRSDTESPATTSMDQGSNGRKRRKRVLWSTFETVYFINLYTDVLNSSADSKIRSSLYSHLVAPMAAAGYYRNAFQLKEKWFKLKKSYTLDSAKIEKDCNATTGPYFHLLDIVLGCKPNDFCPTNVCEVVLNSPPRNKIAENLSINTEYDSDTDFTKIDDKKETENFICISKNEPQMDNVETTAVV